MDAFIQGIIAGVGMLGGMCAFNYWMFNILEKRLENKIDQISTDIHKVADELKEERKSKDALYKFVLDQYNK